MQSHKQAVLQPHSKCASASIFNWMNSTRCCCSKRTKKKKKITTTVPLITSRDGWKHMRHLSRTYVVFAPWKVKRTFSSIQRTNWIKFHFDIQHEHRFSMFIQLCRLLSTLFYSSAHCSHAHMLISHLQRLPKVMIINAILCNGSTLCYDFPLDNHFQCQIIQFIRTNNTSDLSIWMENMVMCASMPLQSTTLKWGFCVCFPLPFIRKGKITTNTIQL